MARDCVTIRSPRCSRFTGAVGVALLVASVGGCDSRAAARHDSVVLARSRPVPLDLVEPAATAPVPVTAAEQRAFMEKSARAAWAFVDRNIAPTGLAPAHETYRIVTVWDIASTLAAIYCAHSLNLITDAVYKQRMETALTTIATMPLYDNGAFNKVYASTTARMVARDESPSTTGYGWSVIDTGRLLVWLRIITDNDSVHAPAARAIVKRLDMRRLVRGGYLYGQDVSPPKTEAAPYQEGRVGYEQYAAEGFARWGVSADSAINFETNGRPVMAGGQRVLADRRGADLLTSEPFVVMGLELGWARPNWRALSLSVLAAQQHRYDSTGTITMLSEDAVPKPPAYFYYYLLYRRGGSFIVAAPNGAISDTFPRWVSAKAAFGYHALAPSAYTWKALQFVKWGSSEDRGWTAGVYENTHTSTGTFNLNTSAIVLEAAAYFKRGCALVEAQCADTK